MSVSRLFYCFLFFLVVAPIPAAAAGFGVSPSQLELAVAEGGEASRQLIIYSLGEDSEFSALSSSDALAVTPGSGRISGAASVTVTALGRRPGVADEEIAISIGSSRNDESEVSLSLGTAISVRIITARGALAANAFAGVLLSASIVTAGLAAYSAARRKAGKLPAEFSSAYDIYMRRKG